jgi:glycosyltransferase involved in cell wall biosynthesis
MVTQVSFLIPTYNRVHLLRRAIRSCLAQTVQDIKVIVFDDGSTDKTEMLVRNFKDDRVEYHKGRHRGVSWARNALVGLCKTEFGCWLDSDDLSNVYRVELLLTAMRKWDAPFVRSGYWVYLEKDNPHEWRRIPKWGQPRRHAPATCMFRTELAPKYNTAIEYYGEDVIWESEFVLQHGTGMLLPFGLYYIGRGKNARLSAARNEKKKRNNAIVFADEKDRLWPQLDSKGILPSCRIERLPPHAIKLPFALEKTSETTKLPPLFIKANKRSSGRYDGSIA